MRPFGASARWHSFPGRCARPKSMKLRLVTLLTTLALLGAPGASHPDEARRTGGVKFEPDIPYKTGAGLADYERERCTLDLYLPDARQNFPTLVWLHGGGLIEGDKRDDQAIGRSLARAGIAVVAVNYRLSPRAKYPAYVQDAAAAFAWTRAHIADYGGDAGQLYASGHSAGGYLALMIGLDERYLGEYGIPLSAIAGILPISAQTMTHYTVRAERGVGQFSITADEAAPVHFCRKDTPPMLVFYAEHDVPARAEENAYLVATMQGAGNESVTGSLVRDRDHGTIAGHIANEDDPVRLAIISFIGAHSKARLPTQKAGPAPP